MWERFSYYGMRALLILFMVAPVASGGLGFDTGTAGAVYGLYTSMVYMATLPGGWIADQILGPQRAVLAGGVLIAALGIADDILGMQPAVKFVGQVACATIPVAAGMTIDHLTLPFAGAFDLGPAQYPLTVLWFVAIVNIINFTDGMDGLAAGVVGIGSTTFAIIKGWTA